MDSKDSIKRDRDDIDWVTSTEQGRRAMWKILSYCGVYRDIEGSGNDMLKQIGRRQVGLYLLSLISDASEDRIFEMMKEAKERAIEEKIEYERNNRDTNSKYLSTSDSTIGGIDSAPDGIEGIF